MSLPYLDSEEAVGNALTQGNLTLLYFTADWCGPCQQIKPFVTDVNTKTPSLQVFLIDVDKSEELSKKFEIRKMPTFFLFHQKEMLLRFSGADAEKLGMVIQVAARMEQKIIPPKDANEKTLQPRKLKH